MFNVEIGLIFAILLELVNGVDLNCYMGRNPKGHQAYLSDVCHRYKFSQPPQCLKFTQGEVVTRDCDPSYICERFNIRNRCVTNVRQANLYGEICCCSSDFCNGATQNTHLFTFICSTIVVFPLLRKVFLM